MKYKSHHFINILIYVIKKHSGIKKKLSLGLIKYFLFINIYNILKIKIINNI